MRTRSSWATEPWWARAISRGAVTISSEGFIMSAGGRSRFMDGNSGGTFCVGWAPTPSVPPIPSPPAAGVWAQARAWSSLSLAVSFSAIRRELTNTSVDWWAMMVA